MPNPGPSGTMATLGKEELWQLRDILRINVKPTADVNELIFAIKMELARRRGAPPSR